MEPHLSIDDHSHQLVCHAVHLHMCSSILITTRIIKHARMLCLTCIGAVPSVYREGTAVSECMCYDVQHWTGVVCARIHPARTDRHMKVICARSGVQADRLSVTFASSSRGHQNVVQPSNTYIVTADGQDGSLYISYALPTAGDHTLKLVRIQQQCKSQHELLSSRQKWQLRRLDRSSSCPGRLRGTLTHADLPGLHGLQMHATLYICMQPL